MESPPGAFRGEAAAGNPKLVLTASQTPNTTDEFGDRFSDLVRAVFLDKMNTFDGEFGLIGPCAADGANAFALNSARVAMNPELRHVALFQPTAVVVDDFHNFSRFAVKRHLSGKSEGKM